ncbi:M6 family metalloprotease domain-containing protein [Pseudoalteromonas denitrificans DSM 6059]|uniref:M6 family metalloprotease domain-containing protein n=2 Tax=Pseudoalteromonas TaxID=53246 RepID=A0A1I1KZ82_9GAMM|nr:M6 family metalloprotease domain-containing protein [Pseudoalteromonas denitrificans]SFC66099.1 M6 family metalloprotease domain-containing protein [Pseudoalteromonas denitrificans DSM 6059]
MKISNLIKTSACLLVASQIAQAAIPYKNTTYQFTQPNGDQITLSINGNDYYAEQRTLSGELVIFDNELNGFSFAKVSNDGESIVSEKRLVTQKNAVLKSTSHVNKLTLKKTISEEARQRIVLKNKHIFLNKQEQKTSFKSAAMQLPGQVQGLTIIIQFPDELGTISQNQVNAFLNNVPYTEFGNAQSVRGYFLNVSNNKLDYKNTVTRYYTAKKNKSYYADNRYSSSVRSQELISEALNWLEYTEGFDFSTLSTNSSKQIRGLNIFYAGDSDSAWSKGLWPHMARLSPRFCADNVCTDRYQITNMGNNLAIGTFIHESGHLLTNWPDLYDYDGSSEGSVASFGVMGYGAIGQQNKFKPTPPVAHFRYLAGWDTVTELNPAINNQAPKGRLTHISGSNTSYKWTNPSNANEAFYIEAIHQSEQNQYQPDQGLAIWHVDTAGSNSNEWHPYIQMEHADGDRDPENNRNRSDNTDLFDGQQTHSFDKVTPNAYTSKGTNATWWNGSDSGLSISAISDPATQISFDISTVQPPSGEIYTGSLSEKGQDIHPDGRWFQYSGGLIKLDLLGPNNTDFDLKLERWNGSWAQVDISESPDSQESIQYQANDGYYRIIVLSYSGAGNYTLTVNK